MSSHDLDSQIADAREELMQDDAVTMADYARQALSFRCEQMATQFVAAMVSTIRCDAEYHRYRLLAERSGCKDVAEWFARQAVGQAYALINELEKHR